MIGAVSRIRTNTADCPQLTKRVRFLDLDSTLPFRTDQLAGVTPDGNVEALAGHSSKLDAQQPRHNG